jgi:large subunit ribosomal protein L11
MVTIKLLVEGGAMKPSPAVAQQLGPMGINISKVISDINEATQDFKGMQVPVNLDIDPKTKSVSIRVLSPPVSALIKKEAAIELGSGSRKKMQCGNLAIEQVISVTKQKFPNMLAKDFKGAFLSVLGSAMALGVLIESRDPKEIISEAKDGKFDDMIKSQKTDVSPERIQELRGYFTQVKSKQEAVKKAEDEAKAAEEAKKAQAAVAKPGTPAKTAPAAKK